MLKVMSFYQLCLNLKDVSFSFAFGVIILLTTFYYWIKDKNVVPGPSGIPYLGLYPFLTKHNVLSKMEKYKRKYGDVFSFSYTGKLYISLSSIEAIRELHVQKSDCFTKRCKGSYFLTERVGNGLVVFDEKPWKVLKFFLVQKFYEYEEKIFWSNYEDWMAAFHDLLMCSVDERHSAEKNTAEYFIRHYTIIMNELLFGKNGASGETIRIMVEAFRAVSESYSGVDSLSTGPVAMLTFIMNARFKKILEQFHKVKTVIRDRVKQIESRLNEDEPSCIIEEYYKERNKRLQKNDPSWNIFSDESLVEYLFQFIGHGSLNFGTIITEAINALATYPEEQENVFTEIVHEIGFYRQPLRLDKPYLPYTNAFITECIRTSKCMPFMPSLECTKETNVHGYRIPKGSITLLNFWSAHNDPDMFEDPHVFNPARYFFRDNKGKMPILFGMGKRMCTGESFVMQQLFVCLATIVRNFKVSFVKLLDEDDERLIFAPRTGRLYNNLSVNQINRRTSDTKACNLQ